MNVRKKRMSKKRRKYLLDKAKKSPKKPLPTPHPGKNNRYRKQRKSVMNQLKQKYKSNHRSKKRYYNNTPLNRMYNRVGKPRGTKRITPTLKKQLEEKERRLRNNSRKINRYPMNYNNYNSNNNIGYNEYSNNNGWFMRVPRNERDWYNTSPRNNNNYLDYVNY